MTVALRLLPPELSAFERIAFDPTLPAPVIERGHRARRGASERPSIAVLVNPDAGGVRRLGRSKVERLVCEALGDNLAALHWASGGALNKALGEMLASKPEVLAVVGGDGTARAALDGAGRQVPVAPLPGGSLNLISRAVWGRRSLERCLRDLPGGAPRPIPAGQIGAHRFYAACGFGPLMELDALREDWRGGRGFAAVWARFAVMNRRPFRESLTWSAPGQDPRPASALVVGLGPIDAAFGLVRPAPRLLLEGAGVCLNGWADLAGLGARTVLRGWRFCPGLTTRRSLTLEVAGLHGPVAGLLDGERVSLPERFTIAFQSDAAIAWGPPRPPKEP